MSNKRLFISILLLLSESTVGTETGVLFTHINDNYGNKYQRLFSCISSSIDRIKMNIKSACYCSNEVIFLFKHQ